MVVEYKVVEYKGAEMMDEREKGVAQMMTIWR